MAVGSCAGCWRFQANTASNGVANVVFATWLCFAGAASKLVSLFCTINFGDHTRVSATRTARMKLHPVIIIP